MQTRPIKRSLISKAVRPLCLAPRKDMTRWRRRLRKRGSSDNCGMRSAESSNCGMRSAECGMWNVECGMRNLSDFGLWTLDFGLWTLDFGASAERTGVKSRDASVDRKLRRGGQREGASPQRGDGRAAAHFAP